MVGIFGGEFAEMNLIIEIAKEDNRDYVTPEDVGDTIIRHPKDIDKIRLDLLEIIGKQAEMGIGEDLSLCAFIAWRGTYD